jgi:hypothetical protein
MFSYLIGSIVDIYDIGLFQTCIDSICMKNQYGDINNDTNFPPVYSKRLSNAGPLALVGVIIQLVVGVLCFLTAFIYLPPKPSITCYITPLIIFIAFLFQLSTIGEAANGIYLNGRSSSVFEATLVLQLIVIVLTILAADRIQTQINDEYV